MLAVNNYHRRKGWEVTHFTKSRKKKKRESKQINKSRRNNNRRGKHPGSNQVQQRLTEAWNQGTNICDQNNSAQPSQVDESYGFCQGHRRLAKHSNDIRVFSHNVNGVSYDKSNDKSIQCVNHLKAQDNNTVSLWQEIQVYWPKVPTDSKWLARDKKINYRTVFGYNRLEDPTPLEPTQQGGTAATAGSFIVSSFSFANNNTFVSSRALFTFCLFALVCISQDRNQEVFSFVV